MIEANAALFHDGRHGGDRTRITSGGAMRFGPDENRRDALKIGSQSRSSGIAEFLHSHFISPAQRFPELRRATHDRNNAGFGSSRRSAV